jgi:hypothetical protein
MGKGGGVMDKESLFMAILADVIMVFLKALLWCIGTVIFLYLFKIFGFPKFWEKLFERLSRWSNSNVPESIVPNRQIVIVFWISGLKFFIPV